MSDILPGSRCRERSKGKQEDGMRRTKNKKIKGRRDVRKQAANQERMGVAEAEGGKCFEKTDAAQTQNKK